MYFISARAIGRIENRYSIATELTRGASKTSPATAVSLISRRFWFIVQPFPCTPLLRYPVTMCPSAIWSARGKAPAEEPSFCMLGYRRRHNSLHFETCWNISAMYGDLIPNVLLWTATVWLGCGNKGCSNGSDVSDFDMVTTLEMLQIPLVFSVL